MDLYKTALSALILAPIAGVVSVQMLHGYQTAKTQAERCVSESEMQLAQITDALAEDTCDITYDDSSAIYTDGTTVFDNISDAVIRFHIRANSDSEEDQLLKLEVRDAILEYMEPILSVADNREEARTLLEEHTADMEAVGLAVIQEEGYDYDLQVYLTKEEFPVKSYGDLLFPSGEYEALRVDIGNHEGGNWWCVMYPGLCFVETAGGVVATEGKEELQQVLTPEQYETLILYPNEDDQIEYRSYIWDKLVNKK